MINAQQLFVMLALINVVLPINAAKFFRVIAKIAAFQIIDMNDFFHKMLDISPTEPYGKNFEELGFESQYILNCMSIMVFFYVLYPVSILINWILGKYCKFNFCCIKFQKSYRQAIYFSILITVLFESYAIMAMSSFIGLQILDFG